MDFANAFEEIETVLWGHPGVQDTVMIVREDHPGEKRLVVYYAGTDTPEALRGVSAGEAAWANGICGLYTDCSLTNKTQR